MAVRTLHLALLITVIGVSWAADSVQVISGVFMPLNISVDYDGAKTACALQNSRLATLAEITSAFRNGYEYCKWGWIEEKRVVMLRLTPFEACSDYSVGILIRDCPNIRYTNCWNTSAGSVLQLPIPTRLIPSYENASKTCIANGYTIATKEQVAANASNISSLLSWYNWGVGQAINGSFVPDTCDDTLSHASAFCYNPALSDVLIPKDTQTWKKIAIGCIIALIFVILILTALFMRGNKCICCMPRTQPHGPETTQVPVPTWNTTSVYRRISHVNRSTTYDNVGLEKRLPIIQPEMNFYKTHYSNMGFDTNE
ncbi:uncharacterized protein RB166_015145 [Leptodactylus fuscus]|uniref:uncharacterized protein LOC142214688 n=1 Tax=Leptodactylus fuscus TaxID=238119 RepID=UPI003F4F1346